MTNKKRKGFTIVELVIVIAVIAILAGVLIPTFASIIDKANQSSDIQAVRQMNVVLMAESVEDKPTDVNKVIEIVSEAGYDTKEKRTPKSSGHGFYWHSGTNTIILVKTTNPAELIYPLDNEELRNAFDDKKADWANDHDGFEDLAVEVEPSEGGTIINVNAENLIDALKTGGNLRLEESVTISLYNDTEAVEIPSGIETSLDLNGCILTLADNMYENYCDVISVSGIFTIKDTSTSSNGPTGKIAITEPGGGVGSYFAGKAAICVNEGGELNLSGVNVEGSGYRNIMNKGTLNLYEGTSFTITEDGNDGIENRGAATIKGTNFTVSYGRGFINKSEEDEVTITGGSFTASDPSGVLIYGDSGSMTINGTQFFDSISNEYSQINMIGWYSDGTLTLTDAKFNDSDDLRTNTYGNGVDASVGTVAISGGTYNCNLLLVGASATFENGTYNGLVTYENGTVSSGTFNGGFKVCNNGEVTISGGKFTKTVQLYGDDFTTLNIKGGEFIANSTEDIIIEAVEHGEINITGGKFKGKIKMTWEHYTYVQSYIHIFNYNPTDPNVTYPMFYKDTTNGVENYTSFYAAGYCNSTEIIIVQQPGFSSAIDNAWVIAHKAPGDGYKPDTPTE